MTENAESIKAALKEYVLKEFLPGEDPEDLEDDTPLITGGIMDSISTIKFSLFVEEQYGVELQAHELSADYIDTLSAMATIIESKLSG
jgi:acyl carrier protein